MPFDKSVSVTQGNGPYCGAACAVYVAHWVNDTPCGAGVDDEVLEAMQETKTLCCVDLGSTPANVASYIQSECPTAFIYAPPDTTTNATAISSRPWYIGLRAGLKLSSVVDTNIPMPVTGVLGIHYMVIRLISKKDAPVFSMNYLGGHFVVEIGNGLIMEPNTPRPIAKNDYFENTGYAHTGLDLYVYKPGVTTVSSGATEVTALL